MTRSGIAANDLIREYSLRSQLLIAMHRNSVFEYKEVKKIINEYYKDPISVIRRYGLTAN
jgi:hypothetical protein